MNHQVTKLAIESKPVIRRTLAGRLAWVLAVLVVVILAVVLGLREPDSMAENPPPTTAPAEQINAHVSAPSPVEAGKYLIQIGGCNDCHTPGFMQFGDKIPESQWLTGLHVGFKGPWGTTYGPNLRLYVQKCDREIFVKTLRARNARPPMPWTSLHAMSEQDLGAIYQYIKSLGAAGEPAPEFVPPGVEPKTPYIVFVPQLPTPMPARSADPNQ